MLKSAINAGCVDQFISKPWDPHALNGQIRGGIGRSKGLELRGQKDAQAASLMAIQAGTASIIQLLTSARTVTVKMPADLISM